MGSDIAHWDCGWVPQPLFAHLIIMKIKFKTHTQVDVVKTQKLSNGFWHHEVTVDVYIMKFKYLLLLRC